MGIGTYQQCGLPVQHELPEDLIHSRNFVKGSAYSDLYRATKANGVTIAIKRLRFYSEKDKNMLIDELHTWSRLQHRNVARLDFYSFDSYGYPLVVTEWMDAGSAWTYVNSHPDPDVLLLLMEAAEALEYIHGMLAVHSDVKSENILVSPDGHAKLCDFGVSRMVSTSSDMTNLSTGPSGTIRYLPYEFFSGSGEELKYTTESDVWGFGMTIYELMTRRHPYDGLSEDKICLAIMDGEFPAFPETPDSYTMQTRIPTVQQTLRSLCSDCWNIDPGERIGMPSISNRLSSISGYKHHRATHSIQRSQPPRSDSSSSDSSSSSSDQTLWSFGSDEFATRWKSESSVPSVDEKISKEKMACSQNAQLLSRRRDPSVWRVVMDQILSALRALHIVR